MKDKAYQWDEYEERLHKTTDALGCPIDQRVRKAVAACNLLGLYTNASCEGHLFHGCPFPWLDFGIDNDPRHATIVKEYGRLYNRLRRRVIRAVPRAELTWSRWNEAIEPLKRTTPGFIELEALYYETERVASLEYIQLFEKVCPGPYVDGKMRYKVVVLNASKGAIRLMPVLKDHDDDYLLSEKLSLIPRAFILRRARRIFARISSDLRSKFFGFDGGRSFSSDNVPRSPCLQN